MKRCPVCQTPVIGRSDKKFCSDDCRASFHNEKNRITNQRIRAINRILRRNRKILKELMATNFRRIPINQMLEKGFDFEHYTREIKNCEYAGKVCYDITYRLVEEEKEMYVYIETPKQGVKT